MSPPGLAIIVTLNDIEQRIKAVAKFILVFSHHLLVRSTPTSSSSLRGVRL